MNKWITQILEGLRSPKKQQMSTTRLTKRGPQEITNLEDYLTFYDSREQPHYAVLVTGEWGVGKTFQVKKAIPEERRYYVSLFGLQNANEVFAAVFAQMFPADAKTKADVDANRAVSLIGIPVGAIASQLATVFIRDKVRTDRTLIFDDLERCHIKPTDLLGVINRYVEHHGCRVVVIAHEGKLRKKLLEQREKVFGQLIKVNPEIEAAYTEFGKKFGDDSEGSPLIRYREDLISLFKKSEVGSLRILRHVMEDTVRLHDCLSPKQKGHHEASREIVQLVAALNLEARARRLGPNDLRDRPNQSVYYEMKRHREKDENNEPSEPAFVSAEKRYSTVQLDSPLLSDELLQEILFNGVYDATRITASIASSVYFADPEKSPAWKTFIEFQRQPDDIAEEAMKRLEQEFLGREILEPGEMLHVFALRLMMAQNNLINQSIAQTITDCRDYIADLKKTNSLKPTSLSREDREELRFSYGGYTYWVEDSFRGDFEELFRYLHSERESVMLDSLSNAAREILDLIEADGEALFSILNYTAKGKAKYAEVPVLAKIEPEAFLESWMRSHPKNWYWIQKAIEDRLSPPANARLNDERPWCEQLVLLMNKEAQNAGGIRGLRIRRRIPQVKAG